MLQDGQQVGIAVRVLQPLLYQLKHVRRTFGVNVFLWMSDTWVTQLLGACTRITNYTTCH